MHLDFLRAVGLRCLQHSWMQPHELFPGRPHPQSQSLHRRKLSNCSYFAGCLIPPKKAMFLGWFALDWLILTAPCFPSPGVHPKDAVFFSFGSSSFAAKSSAMSLFLFLGADGDRGLNLTSGVLGSSFDSSSLLFDFSASTLKASAFSLNLFKCFLVTFSLASQNSDLAIFSK